MSRYPSQYPRRPREQNWFANAGSYAQYSPRSSLHRRQSAKKGRQHESTLVRAYHDLYGVFYVPPLVGLFYLTLVLATQRILSRMGDGRRAMPFKHLPCDGMDLNFRRHHGPPSKIEPSPPVHSGLRQLKNRRTAGVVPRLAVPTERQ